MTAEVAERTTMNVEIKPREVVLSRVVHAPRDLVYQAFTDADMMAKWFGPHGMESRAISDVRKGGRYAVTMIAPDGIEYPMSGVYEDVVPNEQIRYTADLSGHSDAWKAVIRENLSGPASEQEMVNTVAEITFEDAGDNATLVTIHSYFKKDAVRDSFVKTGMNEGWSQSFERLDSLVTDIDKRQIATTRTLNAPRELVWKVWTTPEHIAQWWGPSGFTNTIEKMDVREGGEWLFYMNGPDGTDYRNEITYDEVVPLERLAYTHGPSPKFNATISFLELGRKTQLTMRMIFPTAEERNMTVEKFGALEGQRQTFARLERYLEAPKARKTTIFERLSDTEVFLSREFDAPRDLLFRVYTDAKLIPEWWGPRKESVVVDKCDLRPGGEWRFVSTSPNGVVHGFHGKYTKVDPPKELAMTFEYEGAPGHVVNVRAIFEDMGSNRSRVRSWNTFSSIEACDGMVNSGMEYGAAESNDRLDEVLARQ